MTQRQREQLIKEGKLPIEILDFLVTGWFAEDERIRKWAADFQNRHQEDKGGFEQWLNK